MSYTRPALEVVLRQMPIKLGSPGLGCTLPAGGGKHFIVGPAGATWAGPIFASNRDSRGPAAGHGQGGLGSPALTPPPPLLCTGRLRRREASCLHSVLKARSALGPLAAPAAPPLQPGLRKGKVPAVPGEAIPWVLLRANQRGPCPPGAHPLQGLRWSDRSAPGTAAGGSAGLEVGGGA